LRVGVWWMRVEGFVVLLGFWVKGVRGGVVMLLLMQAAVTLAFMTETADECFFFWREDLPYPASHPASCCFTSFDCSTRRQPAHLQLFTRTLHVVYISRHISPTFPPSPCLPSPATPPPLPGLSNLPSPQVAKNVYDSLTRP